MISFTPVLNLAIASLNFSAWEASPYAGLTNTDADFLLVNMLKAMAI